MSFSYFHLQTLLKGILILSIKYEPPFHHVA